MTDAVEVLKTTWKGKMSGSGRLTSPALEVKIAIPTDLKGSGDGTHPKELLSASAVSCYVMTLAAMMDMRKLPAADIIVETALAVTHDACISIAHNVNVTFSESASVDDIQRTEALVESADAACLIGNFLRQGGVEISVKGRVSNN
ncbi:TPA: OsmC family protein [Pseudomonas aeruginosa]|nr:OsmC family protein [Pseudomonas aeruginosa]